MAKRHSWTDKESQEDGDHAKCADCGLQRHTYKDGEGFHYNRWKIGDHDWFSASKTPLCPPKQKLIDAQTNSA